MPSSAAQLRKLLHQDTLLIMPCCHDALSARLIEQAGFPLTFMSGFAVSAARLGLPDTGLISYGEMLDQGRDICAAINIPIIGDGDTGYGNVMNIKRTVRGYAACGFAGIMIEDQVWPKRCGHTRGKQVVERSEAMQRLQAAVTAGRENDILIMARTDARATHGLEEALYRCRAFAELGADILFLEAPQTIAEMQTFCRDIPGPKMANMLHQGKTPLLPPDRLAELGYKIAAYPLTMLSMTITAMQEGLAALSQGKYPEHISFAELKKIVGFDEYYAEEAKTKATFRHPSPV